MQQMVSMTFDPTAESLILAIIGRKLFDRKMLRLSRFAPKHCPTQCCQMGIFIPNFFENWGNLKVFQAPAKILFYFSLN